MKKEEKILFMGHSHCPKKRFFKDLMDKILGNRRKTRRNILCNGSYLSMAEMKNTIKNKKISYYE